MKGMINVPYNGSLFPISRIYDFQFPLSSVVWDYRILLQQCEGHRVEAQGVLLTSSQETYGIM